MTTADPDRACPHETFDADVAVNRLLGDDGAVTAFMADVRIRCVDCDEPFRFRGLRAGLNPARPACSVDESEVHLPIRPASSDPDFGLGIPGYAIGYRE